MKKNSIQKAVFLSILLSLGIVLNIMESFIPLPSAIPGIKLGLANIITLFILYLFTSKDAFVLVIMRVVLVGLLRTGLFSVSFFLSIGGALFSLVVMILMRKVNKFSIVGVSVSGAVSHSVGQIVMAMLILETSSIIYYLPFLLLFSIPTGIVTGLIAHKVVQYYDLQKKHIRR